MKTKSIKFVEVLFLKLAVYILKSRNIKRCLYISRKDNNYLWYTAEKIGWIIKSIKNNYEEKDE